MFASTTDASPAEFVHLHVHTEHSKQDGMITVRNLVGSAVADGQPAIAMTDHGSTAGAWRFYKEAKRQGIKPILGIEAYMALVPDGSDGNPALDPFDPQVRFTQFASTKVDAVDGGDKRSTYNHLTILVRNETGWRNLSAMVNAAEDSFWGKPRIDYALLEQYGEGLIVLTGCLGGPVAGPLAQGDRDEAAAAIQRLIRCVGQENVYVEIMEHGLEVEAQNLKVMAELADEAGIPLVATNDAHYTEPSHCHAHSGLLALATGKVLSDEKRWTFNGEGYHLRTEAEMRALRAGKRWQQAVSETARIAERIDDDVLPVKDLRLPRFPVPVEYVAEWEAGTPTTVTDIFGVEQPARQVGKKAYRTASAYYLHHLVVDGAKARYGTPFGAELKQRLSFEESVITGLGLDDYFLIVHDVLDWARSDRGLPTAEHPQGEPGKKKPILVGPGRGSAAGSAVSYCLYIVMVEPIANGLLFERFLDPERVGMPDIDVDFEFMRRGEVYEYLAARYGADYVARIGAFQMAKTKRAIKDAARLLEKTALGDRLTKMVPMDGAEPFTFTQIATSPEAAEFREFAASEPDAAEVLDLAQFYEGVSMGETIHAAGVIISDEPLPTLIPMRYPRGKDKDEADSDTKIALWDGVDIDGFGMLKLDALALRNLDVVSMCCDNIRHTTGEVVDPDALPDPDTQGDPRVDKAFALLRAGKTAGIFQLESSGITELCEAIAPTSFADLSALVALYRPGPMGANMHTRYADRKHGREQVDYSIFTNDRAEQEIIAGVLDETYGVIAYQEQLMILAADIAGFDAGLKNRLRKAVSKKKQAEIDALKAIFLDGGQATFDLPDGRVSPAFKAATLERLWETFNASAKYLFNKAHSAAYGYLAYVTAYLKANWPTEYGAAILSVTDKDDKRRAALDALAQDGITVLPPDVNKSGVHSMPDPVDPSAVRLGMKEIRDVGSNSRWIVHEREQHGEFTSLADVIARVKTPNGDGDLVSKISTTAIEGLIESGACDSLGPRLGHILAMRALLANPDLGIPAAEWGALEQATRQRVRVGFSVGEHPLKTFRDVLKEWVTPEDDLFRGETFTARGAKPVSLHTVGRSGNGRNGPVVTLGLLTGWTEKQGKNGKRANFTIEGSRTVMDGVIWPDSLSSLRKRGQVPNVGDIVAISGRAKVRLVEIEEDGEERTEERVELIANTVWVIDVDDHKSMPAPVAEPVNLAQVIDLARAREQSLTATARKSTMSTSEPEQDARIADDPFPDVPGFADEEGAAVEPTPLRPKNRTILLRASSLDRLVRASVVDESGTPFPKHIAMATRNEADRVMSALRTPPREHLLGKAEGVVYRVRGGCQGGCLNGCEVPEGATTCACQCPGCTDRRSSAGYEVWVVIAGSKAPVAAYIQAAQASETWEPTQEAAWSRTFAGAAAAATEPVEQYPEDAVTAA